MISSDILRGYNAIIVLGLLIGQDSYGYNLMQEISVRSGHTWQMKETTLYSVLSRLEKNGLVNVVKKPSDIGPPRKFFTLNEAGRRELAQFWARWEFIAAQMARFREEP